VEAVTGTCSACGKPCGVQVIDEGVGPYEFWGAHGVDVRLVAVSTCCEAGCGVSVGDVRREDEERRAEWLADLEREEWM
jgi:hypothetical protein